MNDNRFSWKVGDFVIEECDSDRYIVKTQSQKTEESKKIEPSRRSTEKADLSLASDSKPWWKKLWQ